MSRAFLRLLTASEPQAPTQVQIEDALEKTLYGWADELDTGRKFWWADWAKLIGDAIIAVPTGEPVLYPEDEDEDEDD